MVKGALTTDPILVEIHQTILFHSVTSVYIDQVELIRNLVGSHRYQIGASNKSNLNQVRCEEYFSACKGLSWQSDLFENKNKKWDDKQVW